ncbi:MAG: methyltransferase [Alphaproteobacteria bacterium]|nr:methyltransferase [Alphaproteobacteria bacterium]
MAPTRPTERAADVVEAAVTYTIRTGVKPVAASVVPGGRIAHSEGTYEFRTVPIRDGRPLRDSFSLDREGFLFVDHDTDIADFYDDQELRSVYYPEIERLIAATSGARRVTIFDHTLRTSDEARQAALGIREPVKIVHNDYTDWSGPQRLRDILGAAAEPLLERRMAIVQVWRPMRSTVEKNPIAICDASSVEPGDMIAAERRHPHRVGEVYHLASNPQHRWFYFPSMQRDEALVFKTYDSVLDGSARFTAHTAFDDPTSPPGAPPRESIEVRAFAFF